MFLPKIGLSVIAEVAIPHRQVRRVFHPLLTSLPPIVLEAVAVYLWWDSIRELGEFGYFSRAGEKRKRNVLGRSLLGYSRAGAVENRDDDD